MKSRSSSLMLPTRAPRKDFADTHNIFATLPTRDPQCGFPHFVNQAVAKNKEANQYQDDGWGIGAYMHPRAYFLIVACNIINKKSGWLYFHASCCRLQNRCLSRSTCIGGLSLPSSHALRFNQGAERKKNSMLSCSTGANRQFIPSLVFIVIGARRSPSRFPVDAVGILSGTTPGCEAAHSAFAGTKSAASLFAIGAVLAFVSEALLAQVDSELMVSCNVKKEEEGKSPKDRTNMVVVRIRGQLTSFLEDGVGSAFTRDKLFLFLAAYPVLGVNSRARSSPSRFLFANKRSRFSSSRSKALYRKESQGSRSGEVIVSGHKGFTRDYRPAKGKAHRSSFKSDKTSSSLLVSLQVKKLSQTEKGNSEARNLRRRAIKALFARSRVSTRKPACPEAE
ncbi:hypothetical protein V6N11_030956 [Hibiscus sabdariffa]|uniref:Uncharacterized protein n=1 Tax=Hibiscus sabdariffa TaxID=183260 RepID=A0ABR2NRW7_9ROSI